MKAQPLPQPPPDGVRAFDLAHAELGPGRMLIEASAGTGKTYTLAGLVLRLIVEKGCRIQQVLVVTFTEAAVAELRDRVRKRLLEAREVFASGQSTDTLLQVLLARPQFDRKDATARVEQALLDFDEAPVFTIHGFCQRVLDAYAFETGQPYGKTLVTDDRPLREEVARDWWRRELYEADPLEAWAASEADLTVDELANRLKEVLLRPGVSVITGAPTKGKAACLTDLKDAYNHLKGQWTAGHEAVRGYFRAGANGWAKGPLKLPGVMDRIFVEIDAFCRHGAARPDLGQHLELLTPDGLNTFVRAGPKGVTPVHPFFQGCGSLVAACENLGACLWAEALEGAMRELDRLLIRHHVRTYQAQLSEVAKALTGSHGDVLSSALAQRYPVALIDEFQDTDPLQLEIFTKVFGGANSRLWMVGDPKQAIYGFRGADVFTYLHARNRVEPNRVYSLPGNRRSDSRLVDAVNQLFDWDRSFVLPGIRYERVEARADIDQRRLQEGEVETPPLRLWLWESTKGEDSDDVIWDRLAPTVVDEVARLVRLENKVTVGRKRGDLVERVPLRASDIAILVARHQDGDRLELALRAVGIACARQSKQSVYATDEARELRLVLESVINPRHEKRVRAALGTRLLGLDANAVLALVGDQEAWQERLERIRQHLESWRLDGFGRMFRGLLEQEGVVERLLALPDGPRRVTNLQQLGRLLTTAADAAHLQPRALLTHFDNALRGDDADLDEYALRLERDDDAVRILTAHSSKGLQFPVVFCPYLQKPARPAKAGIPETILAHESDDTLSWFYDIQNPPASDHVRKARREKLAESVRLLYVALTRAEHRCYLAWGKRVEQFSGGPAWVLLRPQAAPTGSVDDPEGHLHTTIDAAPLQTVRQAIETKAEAFPGCLVVQDLPEPQPPAVATLKSAPPPVPALAPLSFERTLFPTWGISSFSSLAHGRGSRKRAQRTAADHDDVPAEQPTATPVADELGPFGAGSRLGECVHETLEQWMAPKRPAIPLSDIAAQKMAKFGIRGVHAQPEALAGVLQRALDVVLGGPSVALRVGQVPSSDRLVEVKFHFPLRPTRPADLAACFEGTGANASLSHLDGAVGGLEFSPREGYMTGSIDLVVLWHGKYYLVDWKTNRLPDYGETAIQEAMLGQHYWLQYHLYALALDRYLARRVAGYSHREHFGGVFYLFLRGLGARQEDGGVFQDCPSEGLLGRLRECLLQEPGGTP